MKKTMFKDTLRNIRKDIVSWFSIVIIACLAVAAYLGIRLSADSLRLNINEFYTDTDFRDVEVLATMLLSEDDIKALEANENVEKAVGIYKANGTLLTGSKEEEVIFISYDKEINTPELVEGSLPEKSDECLIAKDIADILGIKPGDTIETEENEYLNRTAFTVTGIAIHPDHIIVQKETPGKRYVMISDDNFNKEAYDNCYSAAEILLKKDADSNRFSQSYYDYIDECGDELDAIAKERSVIRRQEIIDRYQTQIEEKQTELDNAREELDNASIQLEDADKQIEDAEKKLASAYKQLMAKKKELNNGKAQLDDAAAQLSSGKAQLDDARKKLTAAKNELSDGYETILDYRDQIEDYLINLIQEHHIEPAYNISWVRDRSYNIDSSSLTLGNVALTDNFSVNLLSIGNQAQRIINWLRQYTEEVPEAEINAKLDEYQAYIDDINKWEDGHKEYLSSKKKYDEGMSTYNASYAQYSEGLSTYENGLAQYNKAYKQYKSKKSLLEKSKKELEARRAEYELGLEAYEQAKVQIEDAREQLKNLPDNRWVIMNVRGNACYVFTKTVSGNFISISSTFSLLFIFVGALVIYSTVGKNIDEQKKLVGTGKALGLFNSEILMKYLCFGLSSTIIGCIAGTLIAYFVFEKIILGQEQVFFHLKELRLIFEPVPVILVMIFAVVLAIAAVFLACSRLLKVPASKLMQGNVGDDKKRKKKKNKSKASLYTRLIFRNMRYDIRRVAVTVVSVAGCCALILIGLTVSHSMSSAADIQFKEIYRYSHLLNISDDTSEENREKIETTIKDNGGEFIRVLYQETVFQNDDELDSAPVISGDLNEISEYMQLTDARTKEPLKLSEKGIYIPQKLDESSRMGKDGYVRLYSGTMEPFDVEISDSYVLYIARIFLMSSKQYENTFNKEFVTNQYLIRMDDTRYEAIKDQIENIEGVKEFMRSTDRLETFDSFISISRFTVILMTAMAFMMAYFIILNLVNIFVNQKKKELTIMRINGFTVKEAKNYLRYEMIATTVIGIILGIIIGALLAYKIIVLLESINCFDRRIYVPGVLIAASVTAVLSVLISAYALRKVKKLKLSDIA
ncbi:MAG: FtsX-like permease family protein [Erysipelotrichaceae bacterium]|nr:FtsX-like permease family protein [Erysipelotrichaceae bacterium]